jgi:hypothetical protein
MERKTRVLPILLEEHKKTEFNIHNKNIRIGTKWRIIELT